MKGTLAWIIFGIAALTCLFWIGFGVQDDLREDDVFHDIIKERIDIAESPGDEVHIGVAGDWESHQAILRGVELAAEDINAAGGILGRKIVLVPEDDKGTVDGALKVAQSFSSKPEIALVIGHTQRRINAAVAQNYEFYGLLCLAPNTSGSYSSANGFSLLFENGTPPQQTSGAILSLAKEKGWKRLGLLYAKNDYSILQARRFESMANRHDIRIPLSFGYEGRGSGIAKRMERWKRELDLDAMVMAVDEADAVPLISASRVIGIDCPFIVVGERPAALKAASKGLGSVYCLAPTPFDANRSTASRNFHDRFGPAPSNDARYGYDSLNILAQAIAKADSFAPSKVAESLRGIAIKESASDTLGFNGHGTAIKRPPRYDTP